MLHKTKQYTRQDFSRLSNETDPSTEPGVSWRPVTFLDDNRNVQNQENEEED